MRQGFNGRQVACEVDIRKRGRDDERGDQQRDDHPHAEEGIARAGGMVALFGESSFTPGAQDGGDLGHGSYLTTKGTKNTKEFMKAQITSNPTSCKYSKIGS